MQQFIERHASGRNVLIAFGFFLVFAIVLFPLFDRWNGLPEEAQILDLRLTYSSADVSELLAELGEDGRDAYLRSVLIIDTAWPLIYGILMLLALAWAFKNLDERRRRLLLMLPVLTVLIDAVENTTIAVQLVRFPEFAEWFATAGGVVTTIKWAFAGAASIATIVGLIYAIVTRRDREEPEPL